MSLTFFQRIKNFSNSVIYCTCVFIFLCLYLIYGEKIKNKSSSFLDYFKDFLYYFEKKEKRNWRCNYRIDINTKIQIVFSADDFSHWLKFKLSSDIPNKDKHYGFFKTNEKLFKVFLIL